MQLEHNSWNCYQNGYWLPKCSLRYLGAHFLLNPKDQHTRARVAVLAGILPLLTRGVEEAGVGERPVPVVPVHGRFDMAGPNKQGSITACRAKLTR